MLEMLNYLSFIDSSVLLELFVGIYIVLKVD